MGRSQLECFDGVALARGEEDRALALFRAEPPCRFGAVHPVHVYVQEQHIESVAGGKKGLGALVGADGHVHSVQLGVFAQEGLDVAPRRRVVVADGDAKEATGAAGAVRRGFVIAGGCA